MLYFAYLCPEEKNSLTLCSLVHTIFILALLSYENRVSISFNKCLQTQLLNPNAGRACVEDSGDGFELRYAFSGFV